MAIQLNVYEKYFWVYWSRLIKIFSTRRVRQHFYPNNMDELDNLVKDFTGYRRESAERLKQIDLVSFHKNASKEERNIHLDYKADLCKLENTLSEHIINDTVPQFIDMIMNIERVYFHKIGKIMAIINQKALEQEATEAIINQKALEQEAAEAIMLLNKRTRQEEARKRRKEQKELEKQKPVVLRRSSRIDNM